MLSQATISTRCGKCLTPVIRWRSQVRPGQANVYCSHACRIAAMRSQAADFSRTMERLFERTDFTPTCWLWQGARSDNGYGVISVENRDVAVHQVSARWVGVEVPDGYEIDHLCRVRHCWRPSHLEAVPQSVNNLRSESLSAINARRIECVHGHPFTTENTWANGKRRQCRTCTRLRARERSRIKNGYYQRRHCA